MISLQNRSYTVRVVEYNSLFLSPHPSSGGIHTSDVPDFTPRTAWMFLQQKSFIALRITGPSKAWRHFEDQKTPASYRFVQTLPGRRVLPILRGLRSK